MKKLNIKAMAKDMSFQDRARLIFAHCVRKGETLGVEGVLEQDEEDALVDACRKENRINELNRLVALYNMANLLVADVQLSIVSLQLVMSRMETYLYLLTYQRSKKSDFDGVFIEVESGGFVPNDILQKVFVIAIGAAKKIQQVLMSMDYIHELAGLAFRMGEEDEKLINGAKEVLKDFLELNGVIGAMKIFGDMIKEGVVKRKDYKQSILYDFLDGKINVIELNDEEKNEVRARIKRILAYEGHPIT